MLEKVDEMSSNALFTQYFLFDEESHTKIPLITCLDPFLKFNNLDNIYIRLRLKPESQPNPEHGWISLQTGRWQNEFCKKFTPFIFRSVCGEPLDLISKFVHNKLDRKQTY